ncbi:MAG: hypothetical protein ACXW08_11330 [Solirubrobacteraceae bacterium]
MRLRVGLLLASLMLAVAAAPAAAAPASPKAAAAAASSAASREAKRQLRAARARFRRSADSTPPSGSTPVPGATTGPGVPGAPGGTAPGDPEPPPPPPLPDPGAGARNLQVRAGEFWLALSKPSVPAGNVRVEFNNTQAEDPHDLHLVREDGTGSAYSFGVLDSGDVQSKSFALNAGTWSLFCALPEHAERGMTARLTVSGA